MSDEVKDQLAEIVLRKQLEEEEGERWNLTRRLEITTLEVERLEAENAALKAQIAAREAKIAALDMDSEGLRIVAEAINLLKKRNEELEAENTEFREELERQKQGLQTILELRKIAGTDRYGALTRDEIEEVIMGIDAVLKGGKG